MTLITNIQNKTKDFSLTFFLIFTIIFFFSGCSSDNSSDKTPVVTKTEDLVDETVSEVTDDSGVADINGSFISSSDTNPTLNTTQEDNTTQTTQTIATVATDTNATQTTTTDTNSTTLITDPNTTTPKVVVINGHRLPPVPDKTLNDSTLLGIDSNDNGVRDDVEIWIYETYTEPVEIGIFMQSARAYQKVIEDPSKAHETTVHIDNSYSCNKYMLNNNIQLYKKYEYVEIDKELEKNQFNSIERHMAYERFNAEFSGEVFSSPKASKEKCEFDENGILRDLP